MGDTWQRGRTGVGRFKRSGTGGYALDKLDYGRMATVVEGINYVVRKLADGSKERKRVG